MTASLLRAVSDGVGLITLNRPDRMNAITVELARDLERAVLGLGADPAVNVILLRGSGENFCAGGDFNEVQRLRSEGADALRTLFTAFGRACDAVAGVEVPVVAAVEGVHGIFRNMCASIFAVGSEELPARVFLTYFTRKSAFKRFGFHPEGTIGFWWGLANVVESHGGQVWLSTTVTKIVCDGRKVTGVELRRNGEKVSLAAPVVVSDVGPAATVALIGEDNVPPAYQDLVKKGDRPASMISVNFASQERLVDVPGMLSFAKSRRLAYIANFTDMCPEMAPDGWNLYVGTAVPKPSIGDFDEAAETELLLRDLRDNIDEFDKRARILNIAVTRDDWPPQRAVAGFDLPHDTPFAGLWNVGDAVKEYANGGTTACAETAKLVVDKIVAAHQPALTAR